MTKNKGWVKEPVRHGLAAQGVKTARKPRRRTHIPPGEEEFGRRLERKMAWEGTSEEDRALFLTRLTEGEIGPTQAREHARMPWEKLPEKIKEIIIVPMLIGAPRPADSDLRQQLGQIWPGLGPSKIEGLNPKGLKPGQRITIDGVKGKVTSITPAGLPMGYLLGPGGKKSRAAFRPELLASREVKVDG